MLLRHLARFGPVVAARRGAGGGVVGQYNRALLTTGPLHHRLVTSRYFSQEIVANWPEGIKRFLEQEKIEKPTLIQEKTLPIAMENKNLVGIARTGSGKTLAFVIPAVMKVLKSREELANQSAGEQMSNDDTNMDRDAYFDQSFPSKAANKPTCLVLAPTRELATQTASVFDRFQRMGLKTISLVGGASRSAQLQQLSRRSHDVYVATPGRLIDLMETNSVDLSGIKYLVLDEADRMLDMGFEPQIRRLLQRMPKDRQTLMWSATWPKEIQQLASEFLEDYEYVAVDSEKLKANPNIKQVVMICEPHDKLRTMLEQIKEFRTECEEPRVLIFVNTKRMADSMILHLMRNRVRAISIHGDRSQAQRDHALRMFRERMCHVLVATDVAARGLDINDITHVVNFDFPNSIEDYIHRIGRTARHERHGKALSLFTVNESNMSQKLVQVLRETNQEVPEGLAEMRDSGLGRSRGFGGRGGGMNRYGRGGGSMDRYGGGSMDRYGGGGGERYGGGSGMSRRGDDRNDFGYRRSNDRYSYDRDDDSPRRGNGRNRYEEDEDDDDMFQERNDRSYGYGGGRGDGRKARGGSIFDD